jgi:hypothetical protein
MSTPVLVKPNIIVSPISGEPCRPTLSTHINNGKEITEAIWTDHASGIFIRKGVVSIKDVEKPCPTT